MLCQVFILFENLFLVGDFVEIGEAKGTVEAIDFRTSRIRDSIGRVHIVRNGEMRQVINYSKGYSLAVVEIGVSYECDYDQVEAALLEAGRVVSESSDNVIEATGTRDHGVWRFGDRLPDRYQGRVWHPWRDDDSTTTRN